MERKLIITTVRGILIAAVSEDGRIVELHPLFPDKCCADDIYMGTIVKKVASQNAYYVDIGKRTLCYLDAGKVSESRRSLMPGAHIPVIVKKEASGFKKALVSNAVTLQGVYMVLSDSSPGISYSRKLPKELCQKIADWLEGDDSICEAYQANPAKKSHIIVRTAASDCTREAFLSELHFLGAKLQEIVNAPAGNNRLLYRPSLYGVEYLQRISGCTDAEIVTDQKTVYEELKRHLDGSNASCPYRLRFYQDRALSLDTLYHISKYMKEAVQEKVWLRSGGFLMIQKTEALTAIDVNTGKSVHGKDSRKTILHTNKEAALEAARQIRLRNISGMILIDFINLDDAQKREEYHDILREALLKDPVPAEMIDETGLQLVEVVRRRQEPSFAEIITDKEIL